VDFRRIILLKIFFVYPVSICGEISDHGRSISYVGLNVETNNFAALRKHTVFFVKLENCPLPHFQIKQILSNTSVVNFGFSGFSPIWGFISFYSQLKEKTKNLLTSPI